MISPSMSAKICFRAYAISAFYGRFRNCRLQNSLHFCRSITRFSAAATAAVRKIYGAVNYCQVPFVYSILSPFLHLSTLSDVFGSEMLSDESLKDIFDGLVGFTPVKPFECVGTVSEINYALMLTAQRFIKENKKMPYLLDYFYKRADKSVLDKNLLNEYNPVNNVPDDFLFAVKEMYENVSECGFDVQK